MITNHPHKKTGYRLINVYSKSSGWRQPAAEQRNDPGSETQREDYDELIADAARAVSVDPLLIKSVIHAESAFDPRAVSVKGAAGLMQLMPGTARRYGVLRIFNPRENVMAGSHYLRDLLNRFEGNLELALASYNAGENAVLDSMGIPPYEETRNYVSKVMRLYRRYQEAE